MLAHGIFSETGTRIDAEDASDRAGRCADSAANDCSDGPANRTTLSRSGSCPGNSSLCIAEAGSRSAKNRYVQSQWRFGPEQ